jgi:hypothetical protein
MDILKTAAPIRKDLKKYEYRSNTNPEPALAPVQVPKQEKKTQKPSNLGNLTLGCGAALDISVPHELDNIYKYIKDKNPIEHNCVFNYTNNQKEYTFEHTFYFSADYKIIYIQETALGLLNFLMIYSWTKMIFERVQVIKVFGSGSKHYDLERAQMFNHNNPWYSADPKNKLYTNKKMCNKCQLWHLCTERI